MGNGTDCAQILYDTFVGLCHPAEGGIATPSSDILKRSLTVRRLRAQADFVQCLRPSLEC